MQAEAEAQQQLAAANKLLAQFRSTFGESLQLPPDVRQLVEQLKSKEEEVKVLRLQDAQHADAETELYDEIGKLSAAWESLQVQVTSKVFDLAGAEERIMKANLDVRLLFLKGILVNHITFFGCRKPRRTTSFSRLCAKRKPSRTNTSISRGPTKNSSNMFPF